MTDREWKVINPGGSRREVVTKELPGARWLQLLVAAEPPHTAPSIVNTDDLGLACIATPAAIEEETP